jgi:hypothetical protein
MNGPAQDPPGDLLLWTRYFDDLDDAMHDFEVGLARQEVEPLRSIQVPPGRIPDILHMRWTQSCQRITELEFRAQGLREDLRAEFSRLAHGTHTAQLNTGPGYGSSLDVSG